MSNQNRIQHVPAGSGPGYWGPGDQIRFVLTGAETDGAFFLAEVLVPPGGGPPPHIHDREDETFYLLQGALTIWVGDQTLYASQGDVTPELIARLMAASAKYGQTVLPPAHR